MLPLFIFAWSVTLGSQPARAAPVAQTGWQLVWSDEFNGASVDTTKWHVWNAHSNINNEPEYYTPNNVSVSGGNLVIVTKKNDIIPGATEGYTSGRLETYCGYAPDGCTPAHYLYGLTYGKIEVRGKMAAGDGVWPAYWLAAPDDWPPEIDINEWLGKWPTVYHYGYFQMKDGNGNWGASGWYYPFDPEQGQTCSGSCPDLSQGFHTYGVEWTVGQLKYFFDGTLVRTVSDSRVSSKKMFFIINTALAALPCQWAGCPGNAVYPTYHYVDYVRIYTGCGSCTPVPTDTPAPTNSPTPLPTAVNGPTRIELGGLNNYTDTGGNVWVSDRGCGGNTVDRGNIAIANTVEDKIYQTENWGSTGCSYSVVNGAYTVKLHFAETAGRVTGGRIFNVNVENGQGVLNNFDVYATAGGGNIALIQTFNNINVTDGQLNIVFTPNVDQPEINGIEILPAGAPTNTPTRTNTPIPPTNTPTPTPGGTYDDEFNVSTLDPKWSWIRQDAANWSLTAAPGFMRIVCQAGDINGATATAKNILLETAPAGDWTVVTKLTGKPTANWAQAGLIVYQNDDNWVKMVRLYDNANVFQFAKEIAGTFTFQEAADGIASTTSYLKIVKSGTNYSGYYSSDGVNYTQVWTSQSVSLSTIKIGLISFAGTGLNADFDWIHVTTSAPTATPTNTAVPPTATPTRTNTPVPGNTHGGTWAAKANLNSPQSWKNLWQTASGIATNTIYVASIWLKGTGSIEIHVHNGGWTATLASTRCNATSTWTQCTSAAFNTGSNTTLAFAIGDPYNDDPVGVVYLDDAFLGVSGGANKVVNAGFESGNTTWINDDATIYSILQNP